MLPRILLLGALSGAFTSTALATDTQPISTPSYATRITADNAAELVRGGPDAIGGIDDWFITNGTLCAIVSDPSHESEFSSKGGSLVDLGFCGRADDHYSFYHDLLQGSRTRPLDGESVVLEQTSPKAASIVVTSKRDGAQMVTRYTLDQQHPTQLRIKKRLTYDEDDPLAQEFNLYSSLNFNYHSLEPFVFASKDLRNSNGFRNEDFVSRGQSAMSVAARHADTIITPSPPDAEHGITYGWRLISAERVSSSERYPVPYFMLADDSSNAMLVLSDTFYIGDGSKIGWLQLPQLLMLELDDDALEVEEVIYVGKRGDIASVTDQILNDSPIVMGRTSESNVAIHIDQVDGQPVTHIRPNSDGSFQLKLPAGSYTARVMASAQRAIERPFTVTASGVDLGDIALPKPARLSLPQGEAMRLVFVGLNGTPNPNFADTLTGSSVMEDDGEHFLDPVSHVFLAGVAGDKTSVDLAPGDYRVYATRGPEFSLEQTDISISKQSQNSLTISIPKREISTPNYIASDLHVHTGISFDNAFSEQERVRTFVAEHGEVMVASEHDVPVDFSPRISSMGVDDKVVAINAAEVTSLLPTDTNPYSNGHANFFPYQPAPLEFRRGMVNHEDRRWRDIFHDIRQQQGDVVVQLNHPRLNLKLSGPKLPRDWEEIVDNGQFFDHMGSAAHPFNPHKHLHEHPNSVLIEPHPVTGIRDIDFDLIEVINPGGEDHNERIKAVRQDWLALLKQGEKLVGTANSDSHRSSFQVAVPRTMVAMTDDRVSEFDQSEFLRSLKGGNAYGTTGPMITISLGDKTMGQTFNAQRGQLKVDIKSATWIPFDLIKLQVNGSTIEEYKIDPSNEHTLLVPMSFDKDSFVTIEVEGKPSPEYQAVYEGLIPYAFSNPIYVDHDNDGQWSPPGL